MICIIALVVFSILGIFSASHRKIAYEAFDCVFRKITLRKCHTGLDQRLRSDLVGKVMKFSPRSASLLFKYFNWFSWTFVILSLISAGYAAYGGYNFYLYGNCNGPQDDSFCIFDPTGSNSGFTDLGEMSCGIDGGHGDLIYPDLSNFDFPTLKSSNPKVKVIEFGCYTCSYTKEANSDVLKILNRDDVEFVYVNTIIPNHDLSLESALVTECVRQQSEKKFWKLHFDIFENEINTKSELIDLAVKNGADRNSLNSCISDPEMEKLVKSHSAIGNEIGLYGTPTYFIGNQSIVGPKPYRVLARMINSEK